MRLIARFEKREEVSALSHLDVQRVFQRALRRSALPLSYSAGFNPHPLLSFASALAVGLTSEAEWMDVRLLEPVATQDFMQTLNMALPKGFCLREAYEVDESYPALTPHTAQAAYRICADVEDAGALQAQIAELTGAPLWVEKHGKNGGKRVDLAPLILGCECARNADGVFVHLRGVHTPSGSLNPKLFMKALANVRRYAIHRTALLNSEGKPLHVR